MSQKDVQIGHLSGSIPVQFLVKIAIQTLCLYARVYVGSNNPNAWSPDVGVVACLSIWFDFFVNSSHFDSAANLIYGNAV